MYDVYVVAKQGGEEISRFKAASVKTEAETVAAMKTAREQVKGTLDGTFNDLESWLWMYVKCQLFSSIPGIVFEIELK